MWSSPGLSGDLGTTLWTRQPRRNGVDTRPYGAPYRGSGGSPIRGLGGGWGSAYSASSAVTFMHKNGAAEGGRAVLEVSVRLVKDVKPGVAGIQVMLGVVDDGLPVGVGGVADEGRVVDDAVGELR